MPFPLSKVRTLRDYEGHFSLNVRCIGCAHERTIAAVTLAHFAGLDAPVREVAKRFRCSRCNGRDHDIRVVGIRR
jgi:hypothetical protein